MIDLSTSVWYETDYSDYTKRQAVERTFKSLKQSRRLERHCVRGMPLQPPLPDVSADLAGDDAGEPASGSAQVVPVDGGEGNLDGRTGVVPKPVAEIQWRCGEVAMPIPWCTTASSHSPASTGGAGMPIWWRATDSFPPPSTLPLHDCSLGRQSHG